MLISDYIIQRTYLSPATFPSVVVAVPAQNEAEHIAACLQAICDQRRGGARLTDPVGVLLLVNNTSDEAFTIARLHAEREQMPIRIHDVTMAPHAKHAGGARRAAMNLAADWLNEGGQRNGLIFTTDADSIPFPDWVVTARTAIAQGVDCVAGTIDLHPEDEAALPDHVQVRGRLESRYESLLTELFSLLDPRSHDPWPRHAAEAGANLVVTLRAFRAIGGLPDIACGEDRALVAQLEHYGFKVRHDTALRVSTSGRLTGRAAGGVADTIRLRCEEPEAFCDGYLEPAWNAYFRGLWRGRLRHIFADAGEKAALQAFCAAGDRFASHGSFDAFWNALEASDPRLARKLLRPSELQGEISAASVIVNRCRRSATVARTGPTGNPAFVPA